MPLEKSPRDLPKPFSLRVPPLVSDKRVSQLHAPAGVILSDIIRYHADKAQNSETVPPQDSAHLRMMSLSIAMRSLLPDVEGDRARGLQ